MRNFAITILFFSLWITPQISTAQFSTSNTAPYNSVNHLINNVFAGGNVNISNISSYGASSQIGFFSGNATLGMDSGIVLSTGTVNELCNGACPNASTFPGPPGSATGVNFGFPWMGAATGATTNNNLYNVSASVPALLGFGSVPNDVNDAAAISFDFIPTLDTMRFKFIFASKEWPTYPCSSFNDVFGFFVSGPGITGTYLSPPGFPNGAENFANVPGTNIPITITSINGPSHKGSCTNASYPQYFVPNVAANSGISAHYTTVMEVVFPVQACQTYNFTMAIADGSDGALSSFVMLEANSFLASGVQIAFDATYDLGGDSILYEGCGGVDMNITRADNIQNADTIHFNISGNATNGIDYPLLPDSVIFAPGQTDFTHTFTIPNDYLIEGPETIMVFVTDTDLVSCSGSGDTLLITIQDPIPLTSAADTDTVACTSVNVDLLANAGGLAPFTYTWSTGPADTTDTITILNAPSVNTEYYVTITDACSIYTKIDTALLVIQNPIMSIDAPGDTINCESNGAPIIVNINNQMPNTNIAWSSGQSNNQFWQFNPFQTTNYIVTVTQNCAAYYLTDTFTLVVDNPPFSIEMFDDTINCTDGGAFIQAHMTNQTPSFNYQWSNGSNNLGQQVNPSVTTTYYFSATDACGAVTQTDSLTVYVINDPINGYLNNQTISCIGDTTTLTSFVNGGYLPYSYLWNTGETDSAIAATSSTGKTFYTVSVTDICGLDTMVQTAYVELASYDPLVIEPLNGDTFNCKRNAIQINKPQITGGSGNNEASWDNWVTTNPFTFDIIDSTKTFTIKVRDLCNLDSTEASVTYVVRIHDSLIVMLPADTHLCPGDEATLKAQIQGGAGNFTYNWNTLAKGSEITVDPNLASEYSVTVSDDCQKKASAKTFITVSEPTADFTHFFYDANNISFENTSENGAYYLWEFGDGDTSTLEDPLKQYQVSNIYNVLLTVSDSFGCSSSVYKEVVPPLNVFIPEAFTPNGDGLNEEFKVYGEGFRRTSGSSKEFRIVIYDRWGLEVFKSNDPDFGWDGTLNGKPLAAGNFSYLITIEGLKSQSIEMNGVITLIR